MIPGAIERMDERLDAIEAALKAFYEAKVLPRVVQRSLKPFTEQSEADLAKGIVMLVSDGEGGYKRTPGLIGREGAQRILLVGNLRVGEDKLPAETQELELDMVEELKEFTRGGVPRIGLYLEDVQTSRQTDHPYGWFVVAITAGPPIETTR